MTAPSISMRLSAAYIDKAAGQGLRNALGMACRVRQRLQPRLGVYLHARTKLFQVQRGEVSVPAHGGVEGVNQLEAAVDEKPVDHVGAHATADGVLALKHRDAFTAPRQLERGGEAGQTGTYNEDIRRCNDSSGPKRGGRPAGPSPVPPRRRRCRRSRYPADPRLRERPRARRRRPYPPQRSPSCGARARRGWC